MIPYHSDGKTCSLIIWPDMNGTLTIDCKLPVGRENKSVKKQIKIYLLTADTFGSA